MSTIIIIIIIIYLFIYLFLFFLLIFYSLNLVGQRGFFNNEGIKFQPEFACFILFCFVLFCFLTGKMGFDRLQRLQM